MWDLTAGKVIHTFDTHKAPVTALAFNPNEFLMASGSEDRTVRAQHCCKLRTITCTLTHCLVLRHRFFTGKVLESRNVLATSQGTASE